MRVEMRKEINQMIPSVKVAVTVLGAVIALSALDVVPASAQWLVNGTSLVGTAALSPRFLVDEPATLLMPALGLVIQCDGHFLDALNAEIIAPDRDSASSLTFLGCNTTKPADCALEKENQPIETTALLSRAFLGPGESVRTLFAPETKGTFANVAFNEENICALDGVAPIRGQLIENSPDGQLELLTHVFSGLGSVENNSLEIAGDKTFLDGGSILVTLASDSKWSFM